VGFILIAQRILGDRDGQELVFEAARGDGAKRMLLMVVVMTVHSFAEGVAVGVSFGGGVTLGAVITIAIAVHNIPEGVAISAVLRPEGVSASRCALWSIFSSLPQPLMAVPAFLFVETFRVALPYGLGFAAGAMVFMVLVELLPEAYKHGDRAQVATLATASAVGMALFQQWL
jgi:zinc transporter ZupT